jgi:hypothetical protein
MVGVVVVVVVVTAPTVGSARETALEGRRRASRALRTDDIARPSSIESICDDDAYDVCILHICSILRVRVLQLYT